MQFPSPIQFGRLLYHTFRELKNNDPLRMAAATAFFATFALAPILIILIQILGLILDPQSISDHLFGHLAEIIGNESVGQIRQTLEGFKKLASDWYITIGGFIFLIFVATTLFSVIRNSLNQLWGIRPHGKRALNVRILNRVKAFAVIMISGILFLAVLLGEGFLALMNEYIRELWPRSSTILFTVLNQVASILVVTIWFAVIFKYLSDATLNWNTTIAGALFTGILFTVGKLLLGWVLAASNIQTIYGASGSFVLLLLFVFYCSFILYYGAMFTRIWAEYHRSAIEPRRNAYKYVLSEVKDES
ncbi:MAG TPA: YihY/virulence factor BrkB family protein [Flavitalea sp.]|nr:YihY/virulence factor BrkB family protein [Flavitalea sp.]